MEHLIVDGYSVIFQWKEFSLLRVKNMAGARQVLIRLLTDYHDSRGGRLSLVFDGRTRSGPEEHLKTGIQVIFSKSGQTADALIERMVANSPTPQSCLIISDDHAERSMVESLGGRTLSTDIFHSMLQEELAEIDRMIQLLKDRGGRMR